MKTALYRKKVRLFWENSSKPAVREVFFLPELFRNVLRTVISNETAVEEQPG